MSNVNYEINTREAHMNPNLCNRINSSGKILTLDKDSMTVVISPLLLLVGEKVKSADLEEHIAEAKTKKIENTMTRKLIKPEEKNNGGYVLTGLLIVSSILILGVIIFNVVKYILG